MPACVFSSYACSVTDLERSINWFTKHLGFTDVFRAPEAGWAEMTTPTDGVTLGLGQNDSVDGRGGTTPVFGVADIVSARRQLEDGGVRFDGDTMEIPGLVKLATFFDPDGNTCMLAESLGG